MLGTFSEPSSSQNNPDSIQTIRKEDLCASGITIMSEMDTDVSTSIPADYETPHSITNGYSINIHDNDIVISNYDDITGQGNVYETVGHADVNKTDITNGPEPVYSTIQ